MKLLDAVLMGRFCNLETVEECVMNIEHHAMNMFLYADIDEELRELHREWALYLNCKLTLDWNFIEIDVARQHEEMVKTYTDNPPCVASEIKLNW